MQASDEGLPFNICHGTTWTDSWRVTAVPESDIISVKLMLGVLQLEGKGTRKGLRCSTISGSVLEGRHDPCCVGSFRLGRLIATACMWLYGRAVTRCDGHGHVGQAHHSDD